MERIFYKTRFMWRMNAYVLELIDSKHNHLVQYTFVYFNFFFLVFFSYMLCLINKETEIESN